MPETESIIIDGHGIITVQMLSNLLGTTDTTLIAGLEKNKIPILKLSTTHNMWLVRLEDLKVNEK